MSRFFSDFLPLWFIFDLVRRVPHNFRSAKNKNGVPLLVPKSMDAYLVWHLADDYNWLDENQETIEKIVLDITDGLTLKESCENVGIPMAMILDLSERDKTLGKRLSQARRFRAEQYHDNLAKLADEVDESTAKSSKIKADIYRQLMTVGDRDRFGDQKKISQDTTTTVTFVVETGIRRELPATIEVKELKDERRESDNNQDLDGVPATREPALDSREA